MKIGWLLVLMLIGSVSSISAGLSLILGNNLVGIYHIVLGTIGTITYFIIINILGNKILNNEITLQESDNVK